MILSILFSVFVIGLTGFGIHLLLKSNNAEVDKLKQSKIIFILFALVIITHELKSSNYINFSLLKISTNYCEQNFQSITEVYNNQY